MGDAATSDAERSRRYRAQRAWRPTLSPSLDLLALDAETIAAGILEAVPAEKADKIVTALNRRIGGDADAIAKRLLAGVGTEMARDVAMALQRHLLHGGSWPSWAPRILL